MDNIGVGVWAWVVILISRTRTERIPRIGCVLCVMTLINIIHNYNYTLHAQVQPAVTEVC